MKKLSRATWMVLLLSACHFSTLAFNPFAKFQTMPDTTGGAAGWRVATQADANYWPTVSVNDVILFGKIANYSDSAGNYVSYRPGSGYPTVAIRKIYTNYARIPISGGQKIHIWRGNYGHIDIMAKTNEPTKNGFVESNSSESNPVIITNLGGQVIFGRYGTFGGNFNKVEHTGSFAVSGFNYVYVAGNYTPNETGDAAYPGLRGNLTTHGWINKFGIWGDRKYKTLEQGKDSHGLGFIARSFLYIKVRGVAAMHGFFAGFSVKSDNKSFGDHTKIDIQECLSGWQESEGFYIGSTSGDANSVPDNQVIFKNNVVLFAGAEGIQTDKMRSGSEIKNNFVYKTACFYQVPFQGAHYQENGLQTTYVEGNVAIQNNIIYSGNAGSVTNGNAIAAKSTATVTASNITLSNNLLGPSRRSLGYVQDSPGDPNGLVTFRFVNNVIDSITVPESNDAYVEPYSAGGFLDIANEVNPFYLNNNIYPEGRSLFTRSPSAPTVPTTGSRQQKAPHLLLADQFGFEPLQILNFRGVWFNGLYGSEVSNSGPILYRKGDVVYMFEGGVTKYYRCIQEHQTVKKPSTEAGHWQKLTWNGNDEPTYTPTLKPNTYYNYKGMGLTFNPANTTAIDTIPPVVTAQRQHNFRVGDAFIFPTFTASDNRDGNVTSKVTYYWKNGSKPATDGNGTLTGHGQYELVLKAEDNAGNRMEPFVIKVLVSDPTVTLVKKAQLNFHTFSRANLTSSENYWTDVEETSAGLREASFGTPIVRNNSVVKDTTGALLTWRAIIDDHYNGGYSRFYGASDNGTGAYAIGDFPAQVVKEGLRLREGIEAECHIIFKNLDPNKYYDFKFTGLKVGSGKVNMSVADSASGQRVTFDVINNNQVYELTNLKPSTGGKITIINTFLNAEGQTGKAETSLAGFIITEKQGFGLIGTGSSQSKMAQVHFSYGSPTVYTPGDYWNQFVVTNSNMTYSITNVKAKNGTTVLPITFTVVRDNSPQGFNYNLGGNTGLNTGNNSGVLPDIILSNFAGVNARQAHIQITGLNPSKKYAIQTLSNGRSIWAGLNYTVGITVQGSKQVQNFTPAGGNTSNLLTWSNISPDATGKIVVTVANESHAYGAINALILTEGVNPGPLREAAEQIAGETTVEPITIYPVPAHERITVVYEKERVGAISDVKIVDVTGKTYNVPILEEDDQSVSFDTSTLQGYYILVVESEKGSVLRRNFVVK